jgi:hypothetical protein
MQKGGLVNEENDMCPTGDDLGLDNIYRYINFNFESKVWPSCAATSPLCRLPVSAYDIIASPYGEPPLQQSKVLYGEKKMTLFSIYDVNTIPDKAEIFRLNMVSENSIIAGGLSLETSVKVTGPSDIKLNCISIPILDNTYTECIGTKNGSLLDSTFYDINISFETKPST